MPLEPMVSPGTDTEKELLHSVATSAKSFVRCHKERLDALESGEGAFLPAEVVEACEQLGWLGTLSAPEPHTELGGPLLRCLLFQLGLASPALSAALLGHHVALGLLREVLGSSPDASAHPFGDPRECGWFAQSPGCLLAPGPLAPGVPELSPLLARAAALEGTLPFVIRPHASAPLLAFAEDGEGKTLLVCIRRLEPDWVTVVETLGLRGLGLVDVQFDVTSPTDFEVWASAVDRRRVTAQVWSRAIPTFAALAGSVLSQCEALAQSHAEVRWQAGKYIRDLPQVEEKLQLIRRHRAVTQLIECGVPEDATRAIGLLATIRENLLEATDAGLQVLGGSGYVVGTGMERLWRDARQLAVLLG